MRIERIEVFGYDLHYIHGIYVMSGGRVVSSLPSTVVRVVTDDEIEGWGEVCPLGQTYLPAFAEGARAALRQLAPALIGADPRNLAGVNTRMDGVLLGHGYAKSPLDIACWDILGKATASPYRHYWAASGRSGSRCTSPCPSGTRRPWPATRSTGAPKASTAFN